MSHSVSRIALQVLLMAASLLGALPMEAQAKIAFTESWAYLLDGEERSLDPAWPITDIGYFGAGIGSTGALVGVPKREKLASFKGRVHLVVAEVGSYLATHVVLDPAFGAREAFLDDLVEAAVPFDGVQIDFETILARDKEHFYSFIGELRSRLPGKIFSLAVPARRSDLAGIWEYARLDKSADRIIVMAYDEHWSGSKAGSIAGMDWCRRVAAYAQTRIWGGRLVMGLPFYGRAWADKSLSKAYRYSGIETVMKDAKVGLPKREADIPFFEYQSTVKVKVYYEDVISLEKRLGIYRDLGVDKVSFWRLGQEDARIWARMRIGK